MDNNYRLSVEVFKKLINHVEEDLISGFIRVYNKTTNTWEDIESIKLFGNTIVIHTK